MFRSRVSSVSRQPHKIHANRLSTVCVSSHHWHCCHVSQRQWFGRLTLCGAGRFFLSPFGTTIFLVFLFFASLTLAFGTSWLRVIEWVGAGIVTGIDRIRGGFEVASDKHTERVKIKEARRAREAHLQSELDDDDAYDEHIVDAPPKNPLAAALANSRSKNANAQASDTEDFDRFDKNLDGATDVAERDLNTVVNGELPLSSERGHSGEKTGIAGKVAGAVGRLGGLLPFGRNKGPKSHDALLDGLGNDDGSQALQLAKRTQAAIEEQRALDNSAAVAGSTSISVDATGASNASETAPNAADPSDPADAAASAARALSTASGLSHDPQAASASAAMDSSAAVTHPAESVGSPRKKKIAIKERAPKTDTRQTKMALDLADSELPPLSLLDAPTPQSQGFTEVELEKLSRLLEEKLAEFRISVEVVAVQPGPVITRFEMQPAPGIKASRITGLSQDLARSLSIVSVVLKYPTTRVKLFNCRK